MNPAISTLWVGLGGALGSMARYQLDGVVQARWGNSFPYGILMVNILGSFAMVLLMQLGLRGDLLGPTAKLALTTGVLGGFTTYSTFNHDTWRFVHSGAWGAALLNVSATLVGCFAAGAAGWLVGRFAFGSG